MPRKYDLILYFLFKIDVSIEMLKRKSYFLLMKTVITSGEKDRLSKGRVEAYLNEFKGHVFEFLVASKLANCLGLYSQFLSSLDSSELERLQYYERSIRENDSGLYECLPRIADETSLVIQESVDLKDLSEILLTGRMSNHLLKQNNIEDLAEADLMLKSTTNKISLLSLKFGKYGSFVNTKSGGLKSFLQKYFAPFSSSDLDQKQINFKLQESFQLMGADLYKDLEENFDGNFELWRTKGRSELPGELDECYKDIIHSFYFMQIQQIHSSLKKYFQEDREKFFSCLFPLLGFSSMEIIQVFSFYEKKQLSYNSKEAWCVDISKLKHINSLSLGELKAGSSSFEITHPSFILQIRVKPMNKFTSAALKINCGLKWLR